MHVVKHLKAGPVLFPAILSKGKEKCVTMYCCVLRAALSCDGIKPDLNPKTSDKNGLEKKLEGEIERCRNNLKQKEGNIELL